MGRGDDLPPLLLPLPLPLLFSLSCSPPGVVLFWEPILAPGRAGSDVELPMSPAKVLVAMVEPRREGLLPLLNG